MTDAGPDVFGYRLVVFDLDGTLYRQGPVRRAMLLELLRAGGRPGRIVRLRILGRFRQLREELAASAPRDFDTPLFARLERETGYGQSALRPLVEDWMEHRPLRHLRAARVAGVATLFDALRARGIAITVWSDYPVSDKLKALGLHADHLVAATDAEVGALKPDPAGLHLAMSHAGVTAGETLMVGDRMSRDGKAARAAGVDFLLRADRRPATLAPGQFHLRDFTALPNDTGH